MKDIKYYNNTDFAARMRLLMGARNVKLKDIADAKAREAELAQITGTVQTSDSAAEESGGFPAWIGYGLIALVAVGIIFAATSKRAKKE